MFQVDENTATTQAGKQQGSEAGKQGDNNEYATYNIRGEPQGWPR